MTWLIYKKELKESFNDRKNLFLTLFIPIILNMAFVLLYENVFLSPKEPEQVVVAINEDVDHEIFTLLSEMGSVQWLKVTDPRKASLEGESLLSVVIEPGFIDQVARGDAATVTILSDLTSRKGSQVSEQIQEHLGVYKDKVIADRLASQGLDDTLITPFELVEESLRAKDDVSLMMLLLLLPLMVLLYTVMGGMGVAIDVFSGEKEHKTMEAVLLTPVSRTKLVLAKWLTVATTAMIAGLVTLITFVGFTKLFTKRMAAALDFGDQTLLVVIFGFLAIAILALLSAIVHSVISLLARTYKEAQAYATPFTFLVLIPYFMIVSMSAVEIPNLFYWIPFLNVFALLKELVYGIASFSHLAISFFSSSLLIAILFFVLDKMMKNERWVLGK